MICLILFLQLRCNGDFRLLTLTEKIWATTFKGKGSSLVTSGKMQRILYKNEEGKQTRRSKSSRKDIGFGLTSNLAILHT